MNRTVELRSYLSRSLGALAMALFAVTAPTGSIAAESRGVMAVVNDQPITSFDVDQRIKLTSVLGSGKKLTRKEALELLINDVLKRNETARVKAALTDEEVDAAIERLAKGSNMTPEGLAAKLKTAGISIKALRTQLLTNLSFNRVLIAKYKIKPAVDEANVDKKLAAIKQDPRMQPMTVYEIREIVLPVELNDAFASQLLQARAIEARQITENYKSCKNIDEAVSGIFNVNVGKLIQVPAQNLPKKMRDVLEKAGPSTLIGPMRAKEGIQLVAYCGKQAIAPQAPSREQVKRMLIEQVYDVYEEKYLRDLRRTALIDYKDQSLQQDQTQ